LSEVHAELSDEGLSGKVEVSKLAGESYDDMMNAASNAPAKKQKKASSGYTMEEVAKTCANSFISTWAVSWRF